MKNLRCRSIEHAPATEPVSTAEQPQNAERAEEKTQTTEAEHPMFLALMLRPEVLRGLMPLITEATRLIESRTGDMNEAFIVLDAIKRSLELRYHTFIVVPDFKDDKI